MIIKNLKILIFITFCSLVIALGLYFDGSSLKKNVAAKNLVPSFNEMLEKISYIEFVNNQGSSIIEKVDDQWLLTSANNFPANTELLSRFFIQLREAKIIDNKTNREDLHYKLGLDKENRMDLILKSLTGEEIYSQLGVAAAPSVPAGVENFTDTPVSQMRKVIAKRLSESKNTAPHFYITMDIDMDNAIAARKTMNAGGDVKISFNDLVVKSCALALKKHPVINSAWMGDSIRQNDHVHIGVAVAIEDGLLVPVLRHADQMPLSSISANVKDLAGKAKDKKLQPSDWEGNTFTISNLGMFGVEEFTAIVNPPDAAILAVGGIKQVPVVKDGAVVPGNVMKVTLSCDHRVIDGASGAAFLQTVKAFLENPVTMLV